MSAENFTKNYSKSLFYFNSGRFHEAIQSLNKAIEEKPTIHMFIESHKINALRKLKDHKKAENCYDEALKNANSHSRKIDKSVLSYNLLVFEQSLRKSKKRKTVLENPKIKILLSDKLNLNSTKFYLQFKKGLEFFKAKEWQLAIDCFDASIERNNIFSKNYFYKGLCFHYLKEYGKAQPCFKQTIQLNPRFTRAFYYLGLNFMELKDYSNALEFFDATINLNPKSFSSFFNKGKIFMILMIYNDALLYFDIAIDLAPDSAEAFHLKGMCHFHLGENDTAVTCFNKAIGINSKYFDPYWHKAHLYYSIRDYKSALTSFTRAGILRPNCFETLKFKGLTFKNLKRYDSALECFEKCIELSPDSDEAHFNRAICLMSLDRLSEALDSFDKTIHLNSKHNEAYFKKAIILSKLKNDNEALKHLDKSIKLNSMSPSFYIVKTKFLNSLNRRELNFLNLKIDDEALALLDESIKLSLMNLELYSFKTKILNDSNQEEKAKENSIKTVELNKGLAEDYLIKGINSIKNNNLKNALDYFNEVINRDIENDCVYFYKAFAHTNLHHFKKAAKCLDTITNKKFTDLCLEGICLFYLKQDKEALQCFHVASELSLDTFHESEFFKKKFFSHYRQYENAIHFFDKTQDAKAYFQSKLCFSLLKLFHNKFCN